MNSVIIETTDHDKTEPLLKKNEEHETSYKKLLIYGSIIMSPALLGGMAMSYSAVALPQMKLNISDASWFGAVMSFGSPIGSILTGLIVDKFGRRPSIMISIMPHFLGWLLLILDFQRTITFAGRILTGVSGGCMYVSQAYVSECIVVNHPNWRASLNTWQVMGLSLGMTLTYALSCFLPYQTVAAVAAGLSVLLLLLNYLYIPESPKWLYHQGLVEEAKRSERRLGIHQPILKHIDSKEKIIDSCETSHFSKTILKLLRKDVYKPLLVATFLYIMLMFSGTAALGAYMVDIITVDSDTSESSRRFTRYLSNENISNVVSSTNESGNYLGLMSSIFSVIAVLLLSIVMPYHGIKKLYCFSSVNMSIFFCLLGASFFHFEDESLQNFFNTLHVISVWGAAFFSAFGVFTIPGTILGELFPHDAKGFASIPAIIFCLCNGLAVKFHPYLFTYFDGVLYFLYAFFLLCSTLFVALFLPETVGKSLEEIVHFFSS